MSTDPRRQALALRLRKGTTDSRHTWTHKRTAAMPPRECKSSWTGATSRYSDPQSFLSLLQRLATRWIAPSKRAKLLLRNTTAPSSSLIELVSRKCAILTAYKAATLSITPSRKCRWNLLLAQGSHSVKASSKGEMMRQVNLLSRLQRAERVLSDSTSLSYFQSSN